MQIYQVTVLNPKAAELLQNLADMNLISLTQQPDNSFEAIVNMLREKAAAAIPPTMEEITEEVEAVRKDRYAQNHA